MENKADPEYEALDLPAFRRKLLHWYREHARELPWRGVVDPYRIWVSEVMLQQTRVAAVIDHYEHFLRLFPTLVALALAPEAAVLAAWSGLGYYRRARMLHQAAQFVLREAGGQIPLTSAGLRTLPGVGEYTCAAIASIAFGESVPVIDGNVERVLLRVLGDPLGRGLALAAARTKVREMAVVLMPKRRMSEGTNAAGDHNQAMMELGATVCLPRAPLCLHCPVFEFCRTRGEHKATSRDVQQSRPAAYLLSTRKQGTVTEVLLERRDPKASLMAGMLELPPLPLEAVEGHEPLLRLRHSITSTNYYVTVYAEQPGAEDPDSEPSGIDKPHAEPTLRDAVPSSVESLDWHAVKRLNYLPLTGLARKVLMRARLMSITGPETPARKR